MAISQSGGDSRQPILSPEVVMQTGKSRDDVDGPNPAPGFGPPRIEQWIRKDMSVDEQADGLRINLAAILQEVFNVAAHVKAKAQPLLEYLLRVHGLLECSIRVPLFQQNLIGLCKYGSELTLPFVAGQRTIFE